MSVYRCKGSQKLNKDGHLYILFQNKIEMKSFLFSASLVVLLSSMSNCNQAQTKTAGAVSNQAPASMEFPDPKTMAKVAKSDEEWRAQLGEFGFNVLREAGTERAFTGEYWDKKEQGIYCCAGCNLPLFDSATKYNSGTGWPSFYQPIKKGYVAEHADNSLGMRRTEVLCARCGGHLGHVFDDGPKPTGLRYCINSVSLKFVKSE